MIWREGTPPAFLGISKASWRQGFSLQDKSGEKNEPVGREQWLETQRRVSVGEELLRKAHLRVKSFRKVRRRP